MSLPIQTVGQFHDYLVYVAYYAPDKLEEPLAEAFDTLGAHLHMAERRASDPRDPGIWRRLLNMARTDHEQGREDSGARMLFELEGLIWPSRAQPVHFAIEAERREFGNNVRFAGLEPVPLPRRETESALTPVQQQLLQLARTYFDRTASPLHDTPLRAWILGVDGAVREVSDDGERGLRRRMRERLEPNGTRAVAWITVLADVVGTGNLLIHVNEVGESAVHVTEALIGWTRGQASVVIVPGPHWLGTILGVPN